MPRCCLGLGGNIGDVPAVFRDALQQLRDAGAVPTQVSSLYLTAPVGPLDGSPYHNACAIVRTNLSPEELLRACQRIEDAAGRVRGVRWGSRPVDIDILSYDDRVLSEPHLTLPHPGIAYRRFVLDPLAELMPQWRHPVIGRTATDLQQRLRRRPLPILLAGGDKQLRSLIAAQLRDRFPTAVQAEIAFTPDFSDPTILFVDDVTPAASGLVEDAGGICVRLDAQLAEQDPLAATVAVVTAMLDEPQVVGEIEA